MTLRPPGRPGRSRAKFRCTQQTAGEPAERENMADKDVIERRGKMHAEGAEAEAQADAEAAAKVNGKAGDIVTVVQAPDRNRPMDPKTGQGLLFDSAPVELIEGQIVGDLTVDCEYDAQYSVRRFEGFAKVLEVKHKDRKGTNVRIQHYHVLEVELVPDGGSPQSAREEIEAKLQAYRDAQNEEEGEGDE